MDTIANMIIGSKIDSMKSDMGFGEEEKDDKKVRYG
jgi:hypothetical protein